MSRLLPAAVLPLLAFPAAAQIAGYHDVSHSYHQNQYDALRPAGYRIISISVHNTQTNPRYSVVWRRESGPAWTAFHGLRQRDYQGHFNTRAAQGYRPSMVTAVGSGPDAIMAGIFVRDGASYSARHDQSPSQFDASNDWAKENGYVLRWAHTYGTSSSPRYLGIWTRGTETTAWNYERDDTVSGFQRRFDAYTEGYARPVFVSMSQTLRYLSVWQDDEIGAWIMRSYMTPSEYQTAWNAYTGAGYYPISLHGRGTGASARYSALFVRTRTPTPRQWATSGTQVSTLSGFDDWVRNLMQQNGVRAAQLAVVKDCRLMLARGYTWAEPGYPQTSPTSVFRIASISKPITSVAVHRYFQRGIYQPGTFLPTTLGLSSSYALDPRVNQIRMWHLLSHMGGWDIDALGFDPMFYDLDIANWFGTTVPIDRNMVRSYMLRAHNLNFTPGTRSVYSNFGFSLLGASMERYDVTRSYEQIVKRDIFAPLGVTRATIGDSLRSQRLPNEVRYHPRWPDVYTSRLEADGTWRPVQYGGYNVRNFDAHGGWVMAAPDLAKFLAAFDMGDRNPILNPSWTAYMWSQPDLNDFGLRRGWYAVNLLDENNRNVIAYHHNGAIAGTSTVALRRDDGLSFVLFFNKDIKGLLGAGVQGAQLNAIANGITAWPNHDLFPSVGIPGFKRRTPGRFTHIPGQGCTGSGGGTLVHTVGGTPEIDQSVVYAVRNGRPSSSAALFVGLSTTQWGIFTLPLLLTPFGAPSCTLYTDLLIPSNTSTDARGYASVAMVFPNDTSLIGGQFHTQWVVPDAAANMLGLTTSDAYTTTIGGWR